MGVLFKNSTVTIFNKYYDKENDLYRYKRKIIRGVDWQDDIISNVENNGLTVVNQCTIFMDIQNDYKSPKAFRSNPETGFTLAPGDYIVKGEIDEDIIIPENLKKYDDVVVICGLKRLSLHYEVVCK